MRVHYVSFFCEDDPAEQPIKDYLVELHGDPGAQLTVSQLRDASTWKPSLQSHDFSDLDILIAGGHGHDSLMAFFIGNEPVRWHELGAALKDSLPTSCTFIFYSCNGGYSGIAQMFYGSGGPDFLFGPFNHVDADAMKYAVRRIVDWKRQGSSTIQGACDLVDDVNAWARAMYPSEYDHSFLRVQWLDGKKVARHPNQPGPDKPNLEFVPLKTEL